MKPRAFKGIAAAHACVFVARTEVRPCFRRDLQRQPKKARDSDLLLSEAEGRWGRRGFSVPLLISAQALSSGSRVQAPHWALHRAWSLLKRKRRKKKRKRCGPERSGNLPRSHSEDQQGH